MSRRTTIVLGVVAAVLLGFIIVFERGTLTTDELKPRRSHLLKRFIREKVERIVLESDGGAIELVKETTAKPAGAADDELESDPSEWKIVRPYEAQADEAVIASLLGALEWADARRTIQSVSEEDRKRFGLSSPRRKVTIHVAGDPTTLLFGKDEPTSGGVYAAVVGDTAAYVVGKDLFEAVDHPAGYFRAKALFAQFDSDAVSSLRIARGDGAGALADGGAPSISISRKGGHWWLTDPERFRASRARVDAMLSALSRLKAERFLERLPSTDTSTESPPSLEVTVDSQGVESTLHVGRACGGAQGEIEAWVDEGPHACVLAGDLEPFFEPIADLREARLVTLNIDELQGVVFEFEGQRFELQRAEGWSYDGTRGQGGADERAVEKWLRTLRSLTVVSVEPMEAARAKVVDLAPARGRLVLRGRDPGVEEAIEIGLSGAEGQYVRRDDEPWISRFPADAAAAIRIGPLTVRSPQVLDEAPARLRRMTITRQGVGEVLQRDDAAAPWVVARPVEVDADENRVETVAPLLARLETPRYVAEQAELSHGLAEPRLLIDLHFEGSAEEPDEHDHDGHDHGHDHGPDVDEPIPLARDVRLIVGDATTGGAFGQLDGDPAVFIVPDEVILAIEEPIVSRDLLRVEARYVERATVSASARTVSVIRTGQGLVLEQGSSGTATVDRFVDALAGLRASHIGVFGSDPQSEGFSEPRLRVELTLDGSAPSGLPKTLLIGASRDGRVAVRRSDVDLTFWVDELATRAFFELLGSRSSTASPR